MEYVVENNYILGKARRDVQAILVTEASGKKRLYVRMSWRDENLILANQPDEDEDYGDDAFLDHPASAGLLSIEEIEAETDISIGDGSLFKEIDSDFSVEEEAPNFPYVRLIEVFARDLDYLPDFMAALGQLNPAFNTCYAVYKEALSNAPTAHSIWEQWWEGFTSSNTNAIKVLKHQDGTVELQYVDNFDFEEDLEDAFVETDINGRFVLARATGIRTKEEFLAGLKKIFLDESAEFPGANRIDRDELEFDLDELASSIGELDLQFSIEMTELKLLIESKEK